MVNNTVIAEIRASLKATYVIRVLCEQFVDYGINISQHSKWTMRTREVHLRQFAKFCEEVQIDDIRNVNMIVADAYFRQYSETHSKSTTNTSKRILKVFIAWLEEYKEIHLPVRASSIHSVKIVDLTPKALSTEIIAQVIYKAKEQDSLLIATAFEAGLRIAELVNIKVDDIHETEIKVLGKGSIERIAHVTYELASELQDFIEKNHREPGDYLFQKDIRWGGGFLTSGTARLRIEKAFYDIANIRMYPHQLRHTFAITLLENGCDIVTIQRLLGHQDIKTTMTYLRVTDTHISNGYHTYMPKSLVKHNHVDIF